MHVPARECCIYVGCKRCRESEKNSLNIRKNTEYLRSDTTRYEYFRAYFRGATEGKEGDKSELELTRKL